jgi:hypothetical protein
MPLTGTTVNSVQTLKVALPDGVEETHENELKQRWDNFMNSINERKAEGWTYDEVEAILTNPSGGKISVVPPPKPDLEQKPGTVLVFGQKDVLNDVNKSTRMLSDHSPAWASTVGLKPTSV